MVSTKKVYALISDTVVQQHDQRRIIDTKKLGTNRNLNHGEGNSIDERLN